MMTEIGTYRIQYSFMQAGFDTPTIGCWAVPASSADAALAAMRRAYPMPWVTLEKAGRIA